MKIHLLCVGLLASVVTTVALKGEGAVPDPRLITALDQVIHERLGDTSVRRFGISRVATVHHQQFVAETEFEEAMVADITKAGWETSVFLGSRGLLLDQETPRDISWGAFIVGNASRLDRPRPAALRDDAKIAFKSFGQRASSEFRIGDWYVAARPIRAFKQECVDCHKRRLFDPSDAKLEKGDLIGVGLYAFAKSKR